MAFIGCDAPSDDLIDPEDAMGFREGETTSDEETEARERSPGSGGVWINNGLSAPNVGGIDPAFALSTPQGLSETEGVLLDPETRVAAEYVVECALPNLTSITKTVGGESITLHGQLGLAPEWENGDCDEDCQQWVSACVLARTNVTEESVKIVMRGEHPALGLTGLAAYPNYEASYFGNIFADASAQYVCAGDQVDPTNNHLPQRTCANDPAGCGFVSYDECELDQRCTFVDVSGETVATDCHADGDPDPFHTISVYIK